MALLHALTIFMTFFLTCSADLDQPKFSDVRRISLTAIRVTWDAHNYDVTDNFTDVYSYEVALSRQNCSEAEFVQEVSQNVQTWTFWDILQQTDYTVCLRLVQGIDVSNWTQTSVKSDVRRPPSIDRYGVLQGHRPDNINQYYFYDREFIEIICEASGEPQPVIKWFKDNTELPPSGDNINYNPQEGLLTIKRASNSQQGEYYCVVENDYGRVQAKNITLTEAVIQPFRAEEQIPVHTIAPGKSFEIECPEVKSIPEASISWAKVISKLDPNPTPLEPYNNHRIAFGVKGKLLFLYTLTTDAGMYRCEAHNRILDHVESGGFFRLNIVGREDFRQPPELIDSNPETMHAVEGETVRFKCIFSGRPAPSTLWYRSGTFPTRRVKFLENNRTMVITATKRQDEGVYFCQGRNSVESSLRKKFKLLIHARPVFTESPEPVNVTVGESTSFRCHGEGIPSPEIQWYINGQPVIEDNLPPGRTLSEDGSLLTFAEVTKDDLLSVQCVLHNIHGDEFAFAYLNVAEPTKIVNPPEDIHLIPHGIMKFQCGVISDPSFPLNVTWYRGGIPVYFEKERIYLDADSTLVLNMSAEEDGGRSFQSKYTCFANSGVSTDKASAYLRPSLDDPTIAASHDMPLSTATGDKLLLIGVTSGLAGLLLVCLVLLLVLRRRNSLMVRSNTDTSILSYLSAASRLEEEQRGLALDSPDFPGLRFISDERLLTSLQDVFIPRYRIDLGDLVGKGQFGRVHAGVLRDSRGKLSGRVAIKTLKYKADETEIVELFLREALMMKDFKHPHVLSLIGISVDDDSSPMVILPFMAHGDLRRYIQDPNNEVTVLELLKMGLQVARGMVYLGAMRFVHRDLAARNCMVDINKVVKVADFGLSRDLFSRDYYRVDNGKTPLPVRWMAPESLESSVFTTKSDVWSYGVLLWELMTRGAVPYPDVDNWDVANFIQSTKRLAQPMFCPDSVYEIMLSCWAVDPELRPSFELVVREIETIVNSANTVGSSASHLYININTSVDVTDYREATG